MHAPGEEKRCDKGLGDPGWRGGGRFCNVAKAGDEGGLRGDPAEPAARRDGLAEGVEADDPAGGVQRHEAGGEGFKEGVFVGPRGGGCGGGGVLKIPVRVVFDNDNVKALAKGVDSTTPRQAEGAAGRVLADGDSIHEVWTAALGAGVPVLEDVAEAAGAFGTDALGVHPDGDDADAVRDSGLDAAGVGEVLDEHVVAAFTEEGDSLGEAVGVAARQQDLWVGVRDVAAVQVVHGEVGEKRMERLEPSHVGVLERGADIDSGLRVRGGRSVLRDRDMDGRGVRVRGGGGRRLAGEGEERPQRGRAGRRERVELGGDGGHEAGRLGHGGLQRVERKVAGERETYSSSNT